MDFIPSSFELFEHEEYRKTFEDTLKAKIKAAGHPDSEWDFLRDVYVNDHTRYTVPDSTSADHLADFYWTLVHDKIENHLHHEIDDHLYEVSAKAGAH